MPDPADAGAADGFTPATYGQRFADVYDRWYGDLTDAEACAGVLAQLADGRPVLELGVGTGRLALPLARRGVPVTGVDASPAMLEQLRAKPGADRVEAVQGDMAEPPVGHRRFALVVVAFNTLFNLASVELQRRCFASVAGLLAPGGAFVVEAFVPSDDPGTGAGGPTVGDVSPTRITADQVVLTATLHDPGSQIITGQHIDITEAGTVLRPWRIRYSRPDELDRFAVDAGLVLAERWSDWDRAPFDADSVTHVSLYRTARPDGDPGTGPSVGS